LHIAIVFYEIWSTFYLSSQSINLNIVFTLKIIKFLTKIKFIEKNV